MANTRISLDHLEEFVELTLTRNMTVLARQNGTQKSGISRRLSSLERALGQDLLIRKKRDLRTTPTGTELKNRILPLLVEIRRQISEFERSLDAPAESPINERSSLPVSSS
jgi:DNA-binding transcriptional LysR family regulator